MRAGLDESGRVVTLKAENAEEFMKLCRADFEGIKIVQWRPSRAETGYIDNPTCQLPNLALEDWEHA